jgi:hypothetical protein
MADYEGYLLLHDTGRVADPVYFELENGLLQYYTKKNGKWLGQYSLTRHRVVSRPVKGAPNPNRFVLELTPVRSVHDTERSISQFKRVTIVFSASTPRVMQEWIRAFYMWRRRNWCDGSVIADHDDEFNVLRMMMQIHRLEPKLTQDVDMTIRKVTMTPEMDTEQDAAELGKKNMLMTPRTRLSMLKLGRWAIPAVKSTKNSAIL